MLLNKIFFIYCDPEQKMFSCFINTKLTFLIWNSNLEATVVKTDEIRDIKQLFTHCFLLIEKNFFFENN